MSPKYQDFCLEPSQTFISSPLHWVWIFLLHSGGNRSSERSCDSKDKKKMAGPGSEPRTGDSTGRQVGEYFMLRVLSTYHCLGQGSQDYREPHEETGAWEEERKARFGHSLTVANKEKPEIRLHVRSSKLFGDNLPSSWLTEARKVEHPGLGRESP